MFAACAFLLDGIVTITSLSSFVCSVVALELVLAYLSVHCRESVESCEKWANSTTQQVDLAFNIFFMIYFFIRVCD